MLTLALNNKVNVINKNLVLYVAFKYIGCFKDAKIRDLKKFGPRKGFTVETCHNQCKNYKYFAIQSGSWCSCDDTYSTPPETYTKQPDIECSDGSNYRNAVYSHRRIGITLILFRD